MNVFILLITGVLLLALSIILMDRNNRLFAFHMRLIAEENEWYFKHLTTHWQQLEGKHFQRFHSLPSSNLMWLMFWLPLSHWEKKLKPIGEYYGIEE